MKKFLTYLSLSIAAMFWFSGCSNEADPDQLPEKENIFPSTRSEYSFPYNVSGWQNRCMEIMNLAATRLYIPRM